MFHTFIECEIFCRFCSFAIMMFGSFDICMNAKNCVKLFLIYIIDILHKR